MGSVLALIHPTLFTWFSGPLITLGLGFIMLGMGLTMQLDDFRRVLQTPQRVLWGVLLQFFVMPFLGWFLSRMFRLPAPFAVGLILVASCPGGTASNVISFLAKVDVPLSVTMTTVSTFTAVAMTPLLTKWLAGSLIHVDAWGLFLGTLQVVVLPVALGVIFNRFFPAMVRKVLPAAPLVAVMFIVLIVSSVVGAGKAQILNCGFRLIGAVFSLHAFGFLMGYLLAKIALRDEIVARTISIEVGMQNSGLGVVLARNNFTSPLVAIPSAISSVFHSIIGSALASFWRRLAQRSLRPQ